VFEKHKEKKALEAYQAEMTQWTRERDNYAELLNLAKTFEGGDSNEIMLSAGETLFLKATNTALVEDRRGQGHYEGHSAGVSVPIGSIAGRSVRYRVGANKGHYVQGAPTPTAIDIGSVFVTNKRVIFQGAKQTRECAFAKLIGFEHNDAAGSTTFSVSNRQKATTIHYGPGLSAVFDFRLDLALAHFKGTVDEFANQLQSELTQLDAQRPVAPALGSPT
jgi:hypothetical protein